VKLFVVDVYPVKEQSMWLCLVGGRDKVCVDRLSATISEPKRFEIWVFRHRSPANQNELLVKRLLGLPGEKIDFRGGDVFVGAPGGELERVQRPPELIEAQMIPVPPNPDVGHPLFDVRNGAYAWEGSTLILTPEPGRTLAAAFIAGQGTQPLCIKDDHETSDGKFARGRYAVPDIRVTLGRLNVSGKLAIVHELGGGEFRKVTVGGERVAVSGRTEGEESVQAQYVGVGCDRGLRIETIDGVFRVLLPAGEAWKELWSEPRKTEGQEGFSGLRIEAEGGVSRVAKLEVARDVHYVWGPENPPGPRLIPPDRMFLVGDNPEISNDSRDIRFGPVPRSAFVGRVRLVVWPRLRIPR
jgi:hypothetical protein